MIRWPNRLQIIEEDLADARKAFEEKMRETLELETILDREIIPRRDQVNDEMKALSLIERVEALIRQLKRKRK